MRLAIYLGGFVCILLCHRLWVKASRSQRPEPPGSSTKIPWMGDLMGLLRYKTDHFRRLRDQSHLPVVTLALPVKVYAVFSLPVIKFIQKRTKNFAFEPIQTMFSVPLCGVSKEAENILSNHMDEGNGRFGDIFKSMDKSLNPGESLNELNRNMVDRVIELVDNLSSETGTSKTVKLEAWLKHHVTLASTDAVYGPHNPFRDSKVELAFWGFERKIPKLVFLPQWLVRNAARNRQLVADAFQIFFERNHHEKASELVKDFYAVEAAYGFSQADRSGFEVGNAVAILANTSAAVFWMVFYVFSNPVAREEIRQEVSTIITTTTDGEAVSGRQHHVDMTKLNSHCPTLVSVFRETLRIHSAGISLRKVIKDTFVSDTYHFRKGAIVLMPTSTIHTDRHLWGPDAPSFNHRRFLPDSPHKTNPAAFRTFGGGTTLCPGRHFATTQIMIWAILLVARFEAEPAAPGGGKWEELTPKHANTASVMMTPETDVEVRLKTRKEYGEGKWTVRLTDRESMLAITAEDMENKDVDD